MRIEISIPAQTLRLYDAQDVLLREYPVSTALNGVGEEKNSFRTPRGPHIIRAKIGAGQACGTVFRARRTTGEIWTPELHAQHPGRDWILSRILWLSGCVPGFNRLGNVDSMQRYIYIHGAPDNAQEPFGAPHSHGCVRMHNRDVIELFDLVPLYTPVIIQHD
ncbi:L,D-transpeptidase catalytic domain [Methylobacillus rhizosphaerae]|uniref:L,D-transpeptidase catalytic domain n=1 Tax=Methylobacillus rhizosphaerae TaxID=551994 RepID=A0A238YB00_9PROT|nr:L,D-transpeptidase [Methylobacillus rhizosphaerae]SNR68446.1 L,D-transpeptidase catalytic domain [Methylobacillus rhizosphaerae]